VTVEVWFSSRLDSVSSGEVLTGRPSYWVSCCVSPFLFLSLFGWYMVFLCGVSFFFMESHPLPFFFCFFLCFFLGLLLFFSPPPRFDSCYSGWSSFPGFSESSCFFCVFLFFSCPSLFPTFLSLFLPRLERVLGVRFSKGYYGEVSSSFVLILRESCF
jgi:hypothetical protein